MWGSGSSVDGNNKPFKYIYKRKIERRKQLRYLKNKFKFVFFWLFFKEKKTTGNSLAIKIRESKLNVIQFPLLNSWKHNFF